MYGLTLQGYGPTDQPHTATAQPDEEVIEVGSSARQFLLYLPTYPHPGDTARVDDCQYGPGERETYAAMVVRNFTDL